MADYVLTKNGVLRVSDQSNIPLAPLNRDYKEYLAWVAAGGVPDPYVPPPPSIQKISDRQFFQQCAVMGVITQDEALAANAAVIPSALLTLIGQLPSDQQFAAKMLVGGATVFERNNPLTVVIGQSFGWSSIQIDDFFRAAALI